MSYDFWYDYQQEVLVFDFPRECIKIVYFMNHQFKTPPKHHQIWLKVKTAKGSYRMRSYALQFFQTYFRRIKCNTAKAEAKEIIRYLKYRRAEGKSIQGLLAEYELEQRETMGRFKKEE